MLPEIILSALVLLLAGTTAVLGRRLYAAQKALQSAKPRPAEGNEPDRTALRQKREQAEELCMDLKRSLTHIHTAIPAQVPGLLVERIQIFCAQELKEQVSAILRILQNGFSERIAPAMDQGDLAQLDRQIDQLRRIVLETGELEQTLVLRCKSWSPREEPALAAEAQKLAAISQELEELRQALQTLLYAVLESQGARTVQARIRRAGAQISAPEVLAALSALSALAEENCGLLDRQTKDRIEGYYLPTLELVLKELEKAERAGEDTGAKVQLSIRVIQILSRVIDAGQQVQRQVNERCLEAEVSAMERLAAMRGDIGDDMTKS